MSLVFVEGLGEVEFNDFEFLTFTDGWNGGQWNNWDVVENPNKYDIIHVSNEQITALNCVSKTVSGVDYDMGHKYGWESIRLYTMLETYLGDCEVCLVNKPIMYRLKNNLIGDVL